jgi:hypothetical protein
MMLQIDIIPSRAGYAGASIEDTVALADEALREELAQNWPALWQRIVTRRAYPPAAGDCPAGGGAAVFQHRGLSPSLAADKQRALVCTAQRQSLLTVRCQEPYTLLLNPNNGQEDV